MHTQRSAIWKSGSMGVALVLILGLTLMPERLYGQSRAEDVLAQVERAFGHGDSQLLADVSADRVEITLFGTSTLFSRGQALYVLNDFFQQYPPRRCSFREATRTDGSWFAAGRYWYGTSDTPLRVYVGLRDQGTAWEMREIRIDKEVPRD